MLGLILAALGIAGNVSPGVVECGDFLDSLARPGEEARSLSGEDGLGRLYVSGDWRRSDAYAAITTAYRSEWLRSGDGWRMVQPKAVRKSVEQSSREARERAWTDALAELGKSVEPYRRGTAEDVARSYRDVAEAYAARFGDPSQPARIGSHPMRTLLISLLEKVGPKALADARPGQRRYFTTLAVPGTSRLPNVQDATLRFDQYSKATADLLGDSASAGHLSQVHEMKWLFGSPSNWSPTVAVTLSIVSLTDGSRSAVVIDQGMPLPDAYAEEVALDFGKTHLADLLPSDEDRARSIEWNSAARKRYPSLDLKGDAGPFHIASDLVPESLAVTSILDSLARILDQPILALLPPGLEAATSARFRAATSLGEALDILGTGHFGLEALRVQGGVVLRPRNGELGPGSEALERGTKTFVKEGLRHEATAADDYALYLAGLDQRALSTPEPGWWITSLIRDGAAYREREATTPAFLLLGNLLKLAGRDGSLQSRLGVLPVSAQALARQFALSGDVERDAEPTSLLTVASVSEADWARAEIALERRTVRAAYWHTRRVRSLLGASDIANVVANWQPGMDAADAPGKLRLQEGECPEYEIRLTLSPHLQVRQTFLGKLQSTGQVVTGTDALSERLRTEVDRARVRLDGGETGSVSPRPLR